MSLRPSSATLIDVHDNPYAVPCGELPDGTTVESFHDPPSKVHSRNQEGQYLQGFAEQLRLLGQDSSQDMPGTAT